MNEKKECIIDVTTPLWKWKEYDREKARIRKEAKTPAEYDAMLKKVIDKLGL